MICTPVDNIILHDKRIELIFKDVTLYIEYHRNFFTGWHSPMVLPEYFSMGILQSPYSIIWPNGYEEQPYNAYENWLDDNSRITTMMTSIWDTYFPLPDEEIIKMSLEPWCPDYVKAYNEKHKVTV